MPAPHQHLSFTLRRSSSWRHAPSPSQSRSQTIIRSCSCSAIRSPSSRCVRRVQHRQPPHRPCVPVPHRSLAQVRSDVPPDVFFVPASSMLMSPSAPHAQAGKPGGQRDYEPPDERIVKLGKTLRILSAHLPTLLVNPLPQDILSPNISLHLFPSTHPHLPAVKGKVAYRAALWTAPVAWGCMPSMPIVGNVKLRILSERMVRAGSVTDFDNEHTYGPEKLVVRWITEENVKDKLGEHTSGKDGNGSGDKATPSTRTPPPGASSGQSYVGGSSASEGTNKGLSALLGGEAPIFKLGKGEQFTGLFIFSFDDEGRIASHTIEHADENTGWEKTAKVVTLTDWLLGKAKWGVREPEPALTASLHPDELHRLAFKAAMSGQAGYKR